MQDYSWLVGRRYGRLECIGVLQEPSGRVLCLCDCGAWVWRYLDSLTDRKEVSCGCSARRGRGFVYALLQRSEPAQQHIRVGFTTRLEQRYREHYAASPFAMEEVLCVDGTIGHEDSLHFLLKPFSVGNQHPLSTSWYKATTEVLELLTLIQEHGIKKMLQEMYDDIRIRTARSDPGLGSDGEIPEGVLPDDPLDHSAD